MSSSNLPEAGAKLTLDLSEWEANWASAAGTADAVMGDIPTDLEVNVEFTSSGEDNFEVPETIDTELNVTEDETSKEILNGINFLATIEKIKIAIDVVGTALNFVKDIGMMVVTPFLDVEDAVARINAQTGGTGIADLGQFIRDIQAADLGTGVDQITEVVIAAKQLGAPIDEATRAALTFTHTFDNQDPVTVMTSLKALSDEFGISIKASSDLMTVFFQQGGNKGGDALNTVDKYATAWHDMGLEIPEALSAITSLMSGGVDTSEAASKMLLDFDNAMTTAAADPNSQQAKLLKVMGIDNPKDAGQAIGAETIDGFASAFTNLPADQQDLVSGLFFGKTGKLDTGAIAGMTTQSDMFKNVTDAAAAAATEIDNSLRGAIDDFVLDVNTKIAELLSSESIDLPGKIEAIKQGFQEALNVLASGGTVGEAIEVGLNIPGFADGIDRFQASVGSFAISVLEIVAGIQDFLGKDSSGTRMQIAQMEKNQLPFDLKVANPDEVSTEINTAIARGLSTDDILKAAGTAITELVSSGSSEDLEKAQALVDSLKTVGGDVFKAKPGLNPLEQATADFALQQGGKLLEAAQTNGIVVPVNIDTTDLQTQIDEATLAAQEKTIPAWTSAFGEATSKAVPDDLETGRSKGKAAGEAWWEGFKGVAGSQQSVTDMWASMTDTGDAGAPVGGGIGGIADSFISAANDLMTTTTTATDSITTDWNGVGVSLTDTAATVVAQSDTAAAKIEELDARIATATTGNTITASFDAVALSAGQAFPAVMDWFVRTSQAAVAMDAMVSIHLRSIIKQLNDLNFLAMLTIGNLQQVTNQPVGGGAGGGGGSTIVTNNVNVNNNLSNNAQAAANGYALASSLRPGG